MPQAGALRAVLAFPSSYSVGITSLGYQVVWATLARRADVDVRRLFTDQGDPAHRHCDLFGLSLSWELDGPVLPWRRSSTWCCWAMANCCCPPSSMRCRSAARLHGRSD